jgi:mannose/cellobiose epimerase-like protein (N-acyl-D-glucosamine 2-epimerase family)
LIDVRTDPIAEVQNWLGEALPTWTECWLDSEHGGFLEEVSPSGAPTSAAHKRVRVQCRKTYVFSHAALNGWAPAAALSTRGYEYLMETSRLPDGGWARTLSRSGKIVDATPDLYDIAFALFALSWRYRLTREREVLGYMHQTLSFVEQRMRGPVSGYWHWTPPSGPRLQNPHMHLLEACLAAFEASEDQLFWDRSVDLCGLFRTYLFDGQTLGERFDDVWRRVTKDDQAALEPGHHFEWTWILMQCQKLGMGDFSEEAIALAEFAEAHGVDRQSQLVLEAIDAVGAPLKATSRAWGNTERLKAWLSLKEVLGIERRDAIEATASALLHQFFLSQPVRGLWVDKLEAGGAPVPGAVPASITYHLHLALSELARLEPRALT